MATTIQTTRQISNPQRMWEYEVDIYSGNTGALIPNVEISKTQVKDVTVPNVNLESFEINFKGRKVQHAGRDASTKTVTINFWETESRELYTFFYDWMAKINNPTTARDGVTKDSYIGRIAIRTFAADSITATGENHLINVWPSELGDISLDYTTSDAMSFAVTFTFDENIVGGTGENIGFA